MAQVVKEEIREGRKVLIYDSGLERDAESGKIIKSADHTLITKDTAAEYHRARREKQLGIVLGALNSGVERADIIEKYGEDAWIWAVAQSAMVKATTPEDPKMIEAARFVRDWHRELSTDPENGGAPDSAPRVFVLLAELRRRGIDSNEVIDVESV
jgi:hypothetical protein